MDCGNDINTLMDRLKNRKFKDKDRLVAKENRAFPVNFMLPQYIYQEFKVRFVTITIPGQNVAAGHLMMPDVGPARA
jgi:hypothetical protein